MAELVSQVYNSAKGFEDYLSQVDTIYIYTDASFSKAHGVAVIGYAIFSNTHEHETISLSEDHLNLIQIKESNNIRAEIQGAITALGAIPRGGRVLLYSDCQTTCNLPLRREKLERSGYWSQSKNRPLANADIYKEFYQIYDNLQPDIFWIKGHNSGPDLTPVQKNFSFLDKAVRRHLRKVISEIL